MKIETVLTRVLSVVFFVALIACGGKKESSNDESAEFDAAKEELKQKIEDVAYNIPPPTEMPYLIEATGADYNSDFVNSKESVDNYMSTFDKSAVNLGIYASDIAYLSSYHQTQESLDYLQTVKQLADHLGVVSAMDEVVIKRFEANIDSEDSLKVLINQAVDNVDKYLKDEQRNKVAALVTAGSFVEGLYISTAIVNTYPKDLLPEDQRNIILTPIIKIILDQKGAIDEVLKLLKSVDQDEEVAQLTTDFEQLQKAYGELNIDEQIKNNRADLMLSDKTLESITDIVGKIRARLIS
ncbi:MAG: hypothetical protein KDC79_00090 [Cyclobacteriaceae bacterium]|nr:hypothetical protein [Cyclobacteriaceae bacterium]